MSETKFTPGPWDKIQHGVRDSRVGANTLLAIVYSTVFMDAENQKANAHLIAAAPELYDALGELTDEAIKNNLDPHFVRIARKALAKARGEISHA